MGDFLIHSGNFPLLSESSLVRVSRPYSGLNTRMSSGMKGWQCWSEKTEWTASAGIACGLSLRYKEARERILLGLDPELSGINSWPSNDFCQPPSPAPRLPCAPPNWWNPIAWIPGAWISQNSLIKMIWPDQGIFHVVLGISPSRWWRLRDTTVPLKV